MLRAIPDAPKVDKFLGAETVAASSALAARLDELQLDPGESPCWDAMEQGRPLLERRLDFSRQTGGFASSDE